MIWDRLGLQNRVARSDSSMACYGDVMLMDVYRCNVEFCEHEFRVPVNVQPDRCPACEHILCGGDCCGDEFSATFVDRVEVSEDEPGRPQAPS